MTTKTRTVRRPQQIEESKMQGYFMISRRDASVVIANKLTGSQCRLWLYLMIVDSFADHTSGGEIKYHDLPSVAEIAIAVGSSPDTVDKDLRKLRKLGLYEYRTVTVQGHNSTAANAKAEAERLKSKSQSSSKPTQDKGSAYLSAISAYLSGKLESKSLPHKDFSASSYQSNYSDFIKTLSEEERANFLEFCREKTLKLSQEVNDIEAWLAHQNKAGKNRWEVYYQKFTSSQLKPENKPDKNVEARRQFQQWRQEMKEKERLAEVRGQQESQTKVKGEDNNNSNQEGKT